MTDQHKRHILNLAYDLTIWFALAFLLLGVLAMPDYWPLLPIGYAGGIWALHKGLFDKEQNHD